MLEFSKLRATLRFMANRQDISARKIMEKKKMSDCVWITEAFIRDDQIRPFVTKKYLAPDGQEVIGSDGPLCGKNRRGESFSAENFPKQLFAHRKSGDKAQFYDDLPD